MSITEKAAYIKGLFEGLGIDKDKGEGKVLSAMLDLLDDLSQAVDGLEDVTSDMGEELDDIYDELEMIDEDIDNLYDEEDEDDDDSCGCGCEDELYQVVCPTCGEEIYLDEGTLGEGKIACPACGEELEFDYSELDEDEKE